MLGFNELHTRKFDVYQPGLGNQMFNYASLRGIAAYNGYNFGVPEGDCSLYSCFTLFDNLHYYVNDISYRIFLS